jgi:hypothetical protein
MFWPHTAILSCYGILSSRSCCSVMPIFAYVMLPAMCYTCASPDVVLLSVSVCKLYNIIFCNACYISNCCTYVLIPVVSMILLHSYITLMDKRTNIQFLCIWTSVAMQCGRIVSIWCVVASATLLVVLRHSPAPI